MFESNPNARYERGFLRGFKDDDSNLRQNRSILFSRVRFRGFRKNGR